MSFTGSNIKTDVVAYLEETPTDSDALIALNEALSKLGDRAFTYTETSQAAVAKTWYSLPAGLIDIIEVENSAGDVYTDWRVRADKIAFGDSDTYKIVHRSMPTALAAITETFPAHDLYRPAVAHYVAGWLKLKDDDESKDGMRLLAQAEAEFERIAAKLRRGRTRTGEVKVVR